jgi:hypothetical protein
MVLPKVPSLLFVAGALLATSVCAAAAEPAAGAPAEPTPGQQASLKFRGYAYDLKSDRFLYTELHDQRIEGDRWLGGTIDYYDAAGKQVAHKILDFTQDRAIPVYRLEVSTHGGYVEGITAVTPERIDMVKKGYGAKDDEHKSLTRSGPTAADSGFHVFLRDHFAELMSGARVSFVFAVAGNLDGYKFRAKKVADTQFEGRPAVKLRVEPDSFLRWLVDPLELTYEPAQRKLVEYRGVSNIHDPATGKAYNVRIVYPSARPADAPDLPAS